MNTADKAIILSRIQSKEIEKLFEIHAKEIRLIDSSELELLLSIHEQEIDELNLVHMTQRELYLAKNDDYGDSIARVRRVVRGAPLVRLYDKLHRFESLLSKEQQGLSRLVLDEKIEDTLMDMANYANLEAVERRVENEKEKTETEDNIYKQGR